MNGVESLLREFFNALVVYYTGPIILDKDHRKTGTLAWGVLFLAIILYDYYAIKTNKIETLTRAFWRNSQHRKHKLLLGGFWTILTIHLLFEREIRNYLNNK